MKKVLDDKWKSYITPHNSRPGKMYGKVLVSFDIMNMFPSIDNKMGIDSVIKILNKRRCKNPPTQCVIEALELCLNFNNSIFNNTNYIQTDGTAQGPHIVVLVF